MFSFKNIEYPVLITNISETEAINQYSENYLIVKNSYNNRGEIYGDIIAILTREEFADLDLKDCKAPKFYIWEGRIIEDEGRTAGLGAYL